MAQPSARVVLQKVLRTSGSLLAAGHRGLGSMTPGLSSAAVNVLNDSSKKCTHTSSTSQTSSGRNVVSISSLFLQDGLEIQEMPILVRLLDKSMCPISTHTFTGELIRPMTEYDKNFQCLLQECASVKDVFKLLEIPSEQVTSYSASAALLRISELQQMSRDWDDLHSFIRTAVMNELTETVRKDLAQLSSETLMSLVSCYMNMESFEQECRSAINGEIEKRIVEEQFKVEELCSLSKLLHKSDKGDRDLINTIWVYIGNHYTDVTDENIATVLAHLPPSHKYLLRVLEKQLQKFWWKMKPEKTVACLNSLVRLNFFQVKMMMRFSHWLFLNIHQMRDEGLMQFLAAFIHFRYSDANFTTVLERYVGARKNLLSTDLLGLVMEYCRTLHYFSPTIMDAAAHHFVQHGHTYSALQMFTVLRPFGQLNYLPKESHQFLVQTEKMLEERFEEFHPAHLSELLCSFAFVDRVPLNFVHRVLTPTFLAKVKDLDKEHEAGIWLEMLQSAVLLDTRGVRIPCLYKIQGQTWRGTKHQKLQSKLVAIMGQVFGHNMILTGPYAPHTIYTIDGEMHLNKEGKPIPVVYNRSDPSAEVATRLAILLMSADQYCVNSGHLMGEFAMRHRHLRKLGYKVVEVFEAEFMRLNSVDRAEYIKKKLLKWIPGDAWETMAT